MVNFQELQGGKNGNVISPAALPHIDTTKEDNTGQSLNSLNVSSRQENYQAHIDEINLAENNIGRKTSPQYSKMQTHPLATDKVVLN